MNNAADSFSQSVTYLAASDALLDGLRLGGAGVWRWRIDSEELDWSQNLEGVHNLPKGSFDGTLSSFQRDLHPEDAQDVWQKITTSIEKGAPFRAVYRTAPRPHAPEKWIETSGGITIAPDGARFLTGLCLDVTERIRNEQQLQRRLVQQNAISRFGSLALNQDNLQDVLDEAVRVAAEVLQVPLTKILEFSETAEHLVLRAGIGWAPHLVGRGEVGIELASQAGYTLQSINPVIVTDLRSETRFSGPKLLHDHEVRSGISVVIPGPTTRPFGVFGIHDRIPRVFDQSDAEFLQSLANIVAGAARQAAAAAHRMLLVREMAHRAGNMLQLVNSIAVQTFNSTSDPRLARKSFSERLRALGRSNFIISRGGWTLTRFSELVDETLKPFGNRITTEGRDILLRPELCFDMGLVLHELATNSMKYGTLGAEDGTVSIKWSYGRNQDGGRTFEFQWEDPLSNLQSTSSGSGFGSKLIRALVEDKWNGVATVSGCSNYLIALKIPIAD